MKHIISFDADAGASQVADEVGFTMRRVPGVTASEVLASVGAGPAFCVIVETDDAKDAEVAAIIDRGLRDYADNIRNVTHQTYRRVN